MSIYATWRDRAQSKWIVLHNHRFWAARPVLRRPPHLRHRRDTHSPGSYGIRRMLAEKNSRIHGVTLRWVEHTGSERKEVKQSCRVVRPYW